MGVTRCSFGSRTRSAMHVGLLTCECVSQTFSVIMFISILFGSPQTVSIGVDAGLGGGFELI